MNFWTESFVQWSPLGTYLATVHRQGAAVWGGSKTFNRLMRFAHPQVKFIDFSPGEKYLITYSSQEPSNPRDTHRVVLNIFDVRTGRVMRDFKGNADEFAVGGAGGVTGAAWPMKILAVRWAGGKEDKYFARSGKNVISVYEAETFSLIDKKSLRVENVLDFSWSPADPILALFVPELGGGNQPARVSLVQIPSKEELRQKNLFSVSDCKMYWQSNGDYLAVKVDRYTKTKKSTYTGFELFRIKERDIPIEVLELENKNDKVIAFAWEPKGHRFAVIHGDGPRPDVSFYSMRTAHNTSRVSKLTTLKGKQANTLYWSPAGRFIILAGLKGFNGQLEFFNVDELETMATAEHFMATDIEWDPTGRYVATAVTPVHEMENGFNMWSFLGKLLYRIPRDHFFQFLWRPRPPSLLGAEKEEEITKNLKKYSKKYEAEDQDVSLLLSEQDREKRRLIEEEWERWVKEWRQLHEEEKLMRQQLRDGEASDEEEEYEAKEVEVEEVMEVKEEVVAYDFEQNE
ncbi:Eukaryotic translation initiation factor 3 subunit B [Asimina triloba]